MMQPDNSQVRSGPRQHRRSLRDLRLLVVAGTTVAAVRLGLTLRRTSQIRAAIAQITRQKSGTTLTPQQRHAACAEVAWSVAATARLVPAASCLTQALSAQKMLARRGVESLVHITIPKQHSDGFRPHAWLLVDDVILLGGTSQDYTRHEWLMDYVSDGSGRAKGPSGTVKSLQP